MGRIFGSRDCLLVGVGEVPAGFLAPEVDGAGVEVEGGLAAGVGAAGGDGCVSAGVGGDPDAGVGMGLASTSEVRV